MAPTYNLVLRSFYLNHCRYAMKNNKRSFSTGCLCKVCVSGWKGKCAVDDSPLGLSITACAVDEMTRRCDKG